MKPRSSMTWFAIGTDGGRPNRRHAALQGRLMSDASHGPALKIRLRDAILVAATLVIALVGMSAALAEDRTGLDCMIQFQLSGWSAIYERIDGTGIVACSDDTSLLVLVEAPGSGFTVGKPKITHGTGRFAHVRQISEVFGTYVQGDVHAGLVDSGETGLLTNGRVTLGLKREGDDAGIGMAGFTIRPR